MSLGKQIIALELYQKYATTVAQSEYNVAMNFKGLFVGVDRYKHSNVPELRCAKRDAIAMHALFTDTLGGQTKLLVDNQATKADLENEFQLLSQCNEDDVVVFYFSGHGSDTHELVTYDTDRNDLSNTSISLELLTEWIGKIPSKKVICILDCCFSGGAGSKVFQTGIQSKSLRPTDELIKQLSGESKIVYTACLGTEEAWEDQRIGHGYLTYHFIEALLGAEEVQDSGKIDVYKLFGYVTKKVKDSVASIGKVQTPTLTGRIEGELSWPIFQVGALYTTAFPDRVATAATNDLQSLIPFGFSQDILDAWGGSIKELNQLQLDAVNDFGLLKQEHLVVSAPTSSGKTMIGELAALHGIQQGKRTFFLLPLKALVNDKHSAFTSTYGKFGLRTIRATGENSDDIPALMRGQYDICLMTYEKFAALVLSSPHILEQVGVVVVDEVQMIADENRGANLEFILTLLKMRRSQGIEPQLIALSAVIGDTNGLERWLGAKLLKRTDRPIALDEGVITSDGTFRYLDETLAEQSIPSVVTTSYIKGSHQDVIIPLVKKLVDEGKQVIVFRETKPEARACAMYLFRNLNLPPAQEVLDLLPQSDLSKSSSDLRTTLSGGVAFHIADLSPEERSLIEEYFRAKDTKLKVIAATTTLAMGVNTPADAVIIAGLEHPSDTPKPYSVAEYKNMVGRAGRLGYSLKGFSYLVAMSTTNEHYYWNNYVLGSPEDLKSRFLDADPRSLAMKVLSASQRYARRGMSAEDISLFLEESFGSFQQKQQSPQWVWDRNHTAVMLTELERHNLVTNDGSGVYSLTQLGWIAGKSGLEVESIVRVVEALQPVQSIEITDPALITISQLTVELDDMLFPINKRSTEKEPQTWQGQLQSQQIAQHIISSIHRNVHDQTDSTLRAKKAVSCLFWITEEPLVNIEAAMIQFGGSPGGAAGAIRAIASRTCDVLPVIADIAKVLHPDLDLGDRIEKLLVRLEIGIPSKIFELAKFTSTKLNRGDYLRLLASDLFEIEVIEQTSDEQLLECLGGSASKLEMLRSATEKKKDHELYKDVPMPKLPVYEG